MAEKNILFDTIPVKWDEFCWTGETDLALLGHDGRGSIEITISTENEEHIPPCKKQIGAWKYLLENDSLIRASTLESVLAYYSSVRPRYVRMGPEFEMRMPALKKAEEFKDKIRLSSINVAWPYGDRAVRIGAVFECTWEPEHGLGVVYEGGDIVEVGMAACACI